MAYERQKTLQKELDGRIPRGLRGDPQNTLRYIVNDECLRGKSFDQSIEFAVNFVRQSYPNFMPKILPQPPQT